MATALRRWNSWILQLTANVPGMGSKATTYPSPKVVIIMPFESGYAKQHEFGHNCSVSDNKKSLAIFKSEKNNITITFCYECWFTWIE
jgi:hypothetical protein